MAGLAGTYDLKDEEQVKAYLHNLGVEYRFQCYGEKIPEGCHRLADFQEAFKKEYEKARKIYKFNCYDNKYGHSCFKFGHYNFLGRGGEKNLGKAYDAYKAGCDNGYAASCHNTGLMYQEGKVGDKKDYVKAKEYFEQACEMGDLPSCHTVSSFYIAGRAGVPKNMEQAFKYAMKGCEKGHMHACVNVCLMYEKGDGVEKNEELSKKFKKRALDIEKQASEVDQITFGQ